MSKKKILIVAGARPNFMKIAPLYKAMIKSDKIYPKIVHTGQHYDTNLSQVFFDQLGLPAPDIFLGAGSGSHGQQTAKIMTLFEDVCVAESPDMVVVVGDVNSTLACSIVAAKMDIPLSHIESGLRSYDKRMPEEINRVVCDSISDYLFTTTREASETLIKENHNKERIFFVGNIMIDTLLEFKDVANKSDILEKLGIEKNKYAALTLHRQSNVDDKKELEKIIENLNLIASKISIIFPVHPKTKKHLEGMNISENVRMIEPMGYIDFIRLVDSSLFVITDSGGIQEETAVLDIPCLVMRENSERPITITNGTSILVGNDSEKIMKEVENIMNGNRKHGKKIEYWDGKTAERIVRILEGLV